MAVRTSPAGGQALPGWVRARAGADPGTVHLTVVEPAAMTADAVEQCCALLRASGYRRAVTNALAEVDARALLGAGFRVSERLELLGRGLEDLPTAATHPPRLRRTRDLDAVAALDRAAFPLRGLDVAGLHDALDATPASRLRIAGTPSQPLGYAVTGLAGSRAYVQRLAVHPEARRAGLARALLVDGLRWARRRRARTAVVNTHVDNHAARALYESSGFVVLPRGLVVLERAL
jgi:[ribosomal protein S18]-alanine N-acetyltransferase